MTGGIYNPLDPNSFMSGGMNKFTTGDGMYIPKYDPNKYSFIFSGKSDMNFGNGGCCGLDGTNLNSGLSRSNARKENNRQSHGGSSAFGITAKKVILKQTNPGTWKGEWPGNRNNKEKSNKNVGDSEKSNQWSGSWVKSWPVSRNEPSSQKSDQSKLNKAPSWSGDWSKNWPVSGNEPASKNSDQNKFNKAPSWSGDWSKNWPDASSSKTENGKSSSSSSTSTWGGDWKKSWPGLPGSFGSISEKDRPNVITTTAVPDKESEKQDKTFQKTEQVLQDIINAVQTFQAAKSISHK